MAENFGIKSGYPYAVGRVRAMEDSVFSREQYSRLIAAEKDGRLRVLAEAGYSAGAEKQELEPMIDAELRGVHELMNEIAPEPELTDLFFHEYDAHNLKALLKARAIGAEADGILLSCGVFDVEVLKVCVSADEYSMLGAAFEPLENLEGSTYPGEISRAVDSAVYAHIFAVLKKRKAPALDEFFRLKAGFTNALTRIRGRALGLSEEAVAKMLIAGDFDEPAAEGVVRQFERACGEKLNACLREARSDPFGPAALGSFINDKQNEARNIRIVFAGGGEDDIDV